MPEMRELDDGRIHLVQGPMCHWRMAATHDRIEQGFVRGKNEMGNEQLEAGNIVGERTSWRKSSSSVHWSEWNDCGSDVLTETCERSVEHAREADCVSLYSAGPTADFPELDTQEWQEDDYDQQGDLLDPFKVREGKREEIDWVLKQKLFDYVPESKCAERRGRPCSVKWVLKNKGEKVRAPPVVREIKKVKSEDEKLGPSDAFSAMPPVESLTALVRHVMTERVDRRAHFYGVCVNVMFTWNHSQNCIVLDLAKLNKKMFGTQDASNSWEKLWGEHPPQQWL